MAAPSPTAEFSAGLSAVAASHALLAEQSAALDLEQLRREPPPQGVVVAVRVRPMGAVPCEQGQAAVVAMEGKVTNPNPDPNPDPNPNPSPSPNPNPNPNQVRGGGPVLPRPHRDAAGGAVPRS